MKRMLNTLYVSTQGAYLRKEGESVVVEIERETKLRVPLRNLAGIVCFGNVLCSPFLLGACGQQQIEVSFLSGYGRFLASVSGQFHGNVLLRRQQYRHADDPVFCASVIRAILLGKLTNARASIRRGAREQCGDTDALARAANRIKQYIRKLDRENDPDVLRGIEGEAARTYFAVFDHLIIQQESDFTFTGRNRRPPLDPVNALLSFLYTLLMHDITGALQAHGLDPFVGFFHRDRPGRRGLALDLMEEFRPSFADRLALTLINRQQVQAGDFEKMETGAVWMTDDGRKKVLTAYQKRKQEEIKHPFLGDVMPIGLIFHAQALLFARYLRDQLDAYPVFVWR